MTRLILLLALILVLWFLVESRLRRLRRRFEAAHQARSRSATARQPAGTTAPTELLVRCDRCGTYIPQSRARLESGGAFCQPSCPGAASTPA